MTKVEREKIKKVKGLLSYILTIDDIDVKMATIEAVIEILSDLE
jgi:hypothetical protein